MNRKQFLVSLVAACAIAPAAFAQSAAAKAAVDAAKARGEVGEMANGLLGFVSGSGSGALAAAVKEINDGRLALYRQAAAKNNVSVEVAGAQTFESVIQGRLKAGEYYRTAAGAWVKK